VKVLLFVGTNFRGFYNMHWSMGSWIHGFNHYRQQSMGKLYFIRVLFSWFKWTMKSAKIRTPRLIMISQYIMKRKKTVSDDQQFHQYQQNNQSVLTPNHWTQKKPWCMFLLKFKSWLRTGKYMWQG
jgi:hypothetical protein